MTLCWDVVFFRLDLLISVGSYTNWNHHGSAQRRRLPVLHIILQFGHVHHQGCPFLWRYRKNARKHCVHNGPINHKSYQSNQNHTNQIKSSKLSIYIAQHIKASTDVPKMQWSAIMGIEMSRPYMVIRQSHHKCTHVSSSRCKWYKYAVYRHEKHIHIITNIYAYKHTLHCITFCYSILHCIRPHPLEFAPPKETEIPPNLCDEGSSGIT